MADGLLNKKGRQDGRFDKTLIVLIVVLLMATPVIIAQVDMNTPDWPKSEGVVAAPEVQTIMIWRKRRLSEGPVMRESFYYYFDDRQVCFQRKALGQAEIVADCDPFDKADGESLIKAKALYFAQRSIPETERIRDGVEVNSALGQVIFHTYSRTRDAGKERRYVAFNFLTENMCVQRWLGAQIDSNTYCAGFDEAPAGLLRRAKNLYEKGKNAGQSH